MNSLEKLRAEPQIYLTLNTALAHIRDSKTNSLKNAAKEFKVKKMTPNGDQDAFDKAISCAVAKYGGFDEGMFFFANLILKALIRDGFDIDSEEFSETLCLIEAVQIASTEPCELSIEDLYSKTH